MVCSGFEPGTAEWLAQTNPLNYGTPYSTDRVFSLTNFHKMGLIHICHKKVYFCKQKLCTSKQFSVATKNSGSVCGIKQFVDYQSVEKYDYA